MKPNFFSKTYRFIVDAGINKVDPLQKQYRTRSINKFCVFCILVSSPYLFIFLSLKFIGPFLLIVTAHNFFAGVILINSFKKYDLANLLLIFTTAFSVLIISHMVGFDSGFHLYLYTAPLFIFWLFSINDRKNIILSFVIYSVVYGLMVLDKYFYKPMYPIDTQSLGVDLYALNMALNLILLFLVFYNYSLYYKILEQSLMQKQKLLEEEIVKRNESETNIKKLFSELSQSYDSLKHFSFVVSHNLKSPLANIRGFLGLYDKEGKDVESNQKIIDYISTSSNTLDSVINDLSYILKSRKQLMDRKEEIVLKDAVEEIKISLSGEIDANNVEIREEYNDDIQLFTIKSILHSVLFNLIQNAIKFRKPKIRPVITIQAERSSMETIVRISDNGVGVDLTKYGDRIFNLYNRFNNKVEGKGIGLYLVKNHLDMMGGSIRIDSREGEGTMFTMKFTS